MTTTKTTNSESASAKAEEAAAAMPGDLREMAEKGIEQAKETYEKIKGSAKEATEVLDASAGALKAGSAEINNKFLEFAQANVNAGFELTRKLIAAKDVKEVVELHSNFARDQFQAYTNQAKELGELSTKMAKDASQPLTDGIKKSLKTH